MLVGRSSESARIDGLLTAVRGGTGRALVVLGEPGIGKSALLQYAERQATGMRRLSIVGVAAEAALPYAGLTELIDRFCRVSGRCQLASRGRSGWRSGPREMVRLMRWRFTPECWRCWPRRHRTSR